MLPRLIPALIAVRTLLAPPLRAEVLLYAAPSGTGQVLKIYT